MLGFGVLELARRDTTRKNAVGKCLIGVARTDSVKVYVVIIYTVEGCKRSGNEGGEATHNRI